METNNQYQSNNNMPASGISGGALGYDLDAEKKRISLGIEEIKKEIADRNKKSYANAEIFPAPIAAMHPEVVDFLLSFNLVSVYDNIAKQTNLDAKGRNALPRIVWQIAQAKNWDGLDQILEAKIPLVHSMHVTVANLLQQNVLSKVRVLAEKPVAARRVSNEQLQAPSKKEVEITIVQALADFPKIGGQNITNEPIRSTISPGLLRPSIKNWVADFQETMGAKKHSPIDRGNFLFHSANGKSLSPSERQKLAIILKSLDEGTLLVVDTVAQVVVFEKAESQSSVIGNQSSVDTGGELKKDDFFEIPGSKPPIGSSEFHAGGMQKTETESDDSVNAIFQEEKKFDQGVGANQGEDNISFSFPQKLPAEQLSKPAEMTAPQTQPAYKAPQEARYTDPIAKRAPSLISPSGFSYEREKINEDNVSQKTQRNIVDLKN